MYIKELSIIYNVVFCDSHTRTSVLQLKLEKKIYNTDGTHCKMWCNELRFGKILGNEQKSFAFLWLNSVIDFCDAQNLFTLFSIKFWADVSTRRKKFWISIVIQLIFWIFIVSCLLPNWKQKVPETNFRIISRF